jgi:hypothetical protein
MRWLNLGEINTQSLKITISVVLTFIDGNFYFDALNFASQNGK